MKALRIEGGVGQFYSATGEYSPIDKINKDDLLRLVDLTLDLDDVQFDPYDEKEIKNQAHQIIYKNVSERLLSLRQRRQEFKDEAARTYLEEYESYKTKS